MSWQQFINLWNQYGLAAAAAVLAFLVLLALIWVGRTIVRWWPVITQFVSTINIVANLPVRLDKIDADNKAIKEKVDTQEIHSNDFSKKFTEHLKDARDRTNLLVAVESRLDSIEEKANIAASKASVAAAKAEVAADQLRPNGGSTIKDKVDGLIPNELAEIKQLLQALTKNRPSR